jgi:hypothetical protein
LLHAKGLSMKKIIIIGLILFIPALHAEDPNIQSDSPEVIIPNNDIFLDNSDVSDAATDKNFDSDQALDPNLLRHSDSKIVCNKILAYAKQFASYYYIPTATKPSERVDASPSDIDETITNVCNQLINQLKKNNISSIDKKHLDFVLNTALSKLLPDTLSSTLSRQLAEQLDAGILQFFHDRGIDTRLIPSEMREEFRHHRNDALKNLRQLMIKHHRNAATQEEITTAIHNAFEAFAETIPHILLWNLVKSEASTITKAKDATSSIAINPESYKLREKLEALNRKEMSFYTEATPALTSILQDDQPTHQSQ